MRLGFKMTTRSAIAVLVLATIVPPLKGMAPNRFERIPQRNVFGLKGQEPQTPSGAPPPSLPNITLTGITTILGQKLVLLKAQPPVPKGGQAPKPEPMILAEGQKEGPIKVLSIDVGSGDVKLDNSGTVMTLNLEKDGAKLPISAVPVAFAPTNRSPGGAASQLPVRAPHWSGPYAPSAPGTALSPTGGGPVPPGYEVPAPPNVVTQGLTPEEQALVQQLRQLSATPPSVGRPTALGQQPLPAAPPVSGTVMVPPGAKPPNTIPPGYNKAAAPE